MRRIQPEKKPTTWPDWVAVGIGLLLAVRTGENVWRIWRSGDRLTQAQAKLERVKTENIQLKGELAMVQSPDFVEREARDKLGFGRDGEVIVILPPTPTVTPVPQSEQVTLDAEEPAWKQWRKLYLKF